MYEWETLGAAQSKQDDWQGWRGSRDEPLQGRELILHGVHSRLGRLPVLYTDILI